MSFTDFGCKLHLCLTCLWFAVLFLLLIQFVGVVIAVVIFFRVSLVFVLPHKSSKDGNSHKLLRITKQITIPVVMC